MKKIEYKNKAYIVVNDSESIDFKDFENQSDKDFLIKEKLIIEQRFSEKIFISFVGEIITPSNNYLSLPKKVEISEETIEITLKMLSEYKNLKKEGNSLFTNKSFSPSSDGKLDSEQFYYNKLLSYFLDFITYEFYYAKKRELIHSIKPLRGEVQPLETELNNEKLGPGVTYKMKNIKNSKFGDIYYSIILKLSRKYGSEKELKKIDNMSDYLKEMGYNINEIEIDENTEKIIKTTELNDIHFPIQKILLSYFKAYKLQDKTTIYAFYSSRFQYVWEFFSQKALKHSKKFADFFGDIEKPKKYKIHENNEEDEEYTGDKEIKPDVFSTYKYLFIGDSKYYTKLDGDFTKEYYQYNEAFSNKFPILILAPAVETAYYTKKRHKDFEILIVKLSIKEIINDVMNDSTICLDKIYEIIQKQSNRKLIER